MDPALLTALSGIPGLRPWQRAPLAPFTTIGVGGRADLLVTAADSKALSRGVHVLEEVGARWTVLGAGSNILIPDSGYRGVVVKLDDEFHFVETPVERDGRVHLVAGAGLPLSRLAVHVADLGLSGLEFACSIPGSVGGAAYMNAGAHGGSMADVLAALHLVSAEGSGWVDAERLDWGYRSSGLPPGAVITAVSIRLARGDRTQILEHHRTLQALRRKTQPRGVRTFGSAFRNPPGDHAGRLLECSGLAGVRRGGAQISNVHANFITNLGDATAADVLGLMVMMRGTVLERQGVTLEPEVCLLGKRFPWETQEEAERDPESHPSAAR